MQPDVSDRSFVEPPWVMDARAFGSWTSAPKCFFFQDFERLTENFAPGRPPGYPRGRPLDIRPKTYSLGCFFVLEVCVMHVGLQACMDHVLAHPNRCQEAEFSTCCGHGHGIVSLLWTLADGVKR